MTKHASQRPKRRSQIGLVLISAAFFLSGIGTTSAAITLTADPLFPGFPDVFTVNPSGLGYSAHSLTETRMIRQTFKNPATFDIGQIVLSLDLSGTDGTANDGAGEGGLIINIYEVANVNGAAEEGDDDWTAAGPGASPIKTWTIPQTTSIPATTNRLGITFSGADIFTLPQRDTGTEGYGLEIANVDGVTNMGNWLVTPPNEVDYYPNGVFYTDTGAISRVYRDAGLSLLAVGAPAEVDGDVDGDRDVDLDDFQIINDNLRSAVPGRTSGDLTGDGLVDFTDFRAWKAEYVPPASVSVPEPASALLAATGLLLACGRLRRRGSAAPRMVQARQRTMLKRFVTVSTVVLALLITGATTFAAITFQVDPDYPPSPTMDVPLIDQAGVEGVFTVDPSLHSVAGRGIANTRQLRQTFQVDETFYVGGITLAHTHGGTDGGYIIRFYEMDDVTAGTWAPAGNPLKVLTIPNTVDVPSTTVRLGFVLTGSDSFELAARGDVDGGDLTGYGMEIAVFDETSNNGNWQHANDGVDNYTRGTYCIENNSCTGGGGTRDFGLALVTTDIAPPGPGDVNEDMMVDLEDLKVIRTNFGFDVGARVDGDLSGNGRVFFEDFREWKDNYPPANPAISSSTAVPEPTTVVLSLVSGLALLAAQRRR